MIPSCSQMLRRCVPCPILFQVTRMILFQLEQVLTSTMCHLVLNTHPSHAPPSRVMACSRQLNTSCLVTSSQPHLGNAPEVCTNPGPQLDTAVMCHAGGMLPGHR